jgi:hypothetical protein
LPSSRRAASDATAPGHDSRALLHRSSDPPPRTPPPGLPRWVHRDLPRAAASDPWRSLRGARVPPVLLTRRICATRDDFRLSG